MVSSSAKGISITSVLPSLLKVISRTAFTIYAFESVISFPSESLTRADAKLSQLHVPSSSRVVSAFTYILSAVIPEFIFSAAFVILY